MDDGHGVDQSNEKAIELVKMAADRAHARAQYNLGMCYNNGEGVDQSKELAREWVTKSAAQGYEQAIEWGWDWRSCIA